MSEFRLSPRPALDWYSHQAPGIHAAEVTGFSLISLAVPMGGDQAFADAIRDGLGLARPAPGQSTLSRDGRFRLIWSAPDQMLLWASPDMAAPLRETARAISASAYLTDQSDAWAALRIEGVKTRDILERMVPVDTSPGVFGPGSALRSAAEHMGLFILCEAPDSYLLLTPRSSARSFLHALETTIRYVEDAG